MIKMVRKILDKVVYSFKKTPFAVRAMFRMLIMRVRGVTDPRIRLELDESEIRLLAEMLVAGWYSTGFRNPKAFGLVPSSETEFELEFVLFKAARITFEHLMMMQALPSCFIPGIDVDGLNDYIRQMATYVKVFWVNLVQEVDISEVLCPSQPQLLDTCIAKVDDLELLYFYS